MRGQSPIYALLGALTLGWGAAAPQEVVAQLRIVSYNTATAQNPGTQTARPGISTILQAIGAELVNGMAKPIDVLLLQEQFSMSVTTQSFVDVLNDLYDPVNRTMYARSMLNGLTSDPLARAGRPGLVYNTQTVKLLNLMDDGIQGETLFGNVGTEADEQPRSSLRYQLRPVGYDSSADFYAYNDHYKSDTGVENNARRLVEAQAVRANADALGQGVHIIYAGDFNIQTSSGTAYQHLLSAGNGQAVDPINMPGSWNGQASFKSIHTQSPAAASQFSGQTLGGVDDRFDFQLVSGEMLDSEGMSYITGSYHAFGNNGTHVCCNSAITTGTGASPAVLMALMQASDHLPVVADYQLPAKMGVEVAAVPALVTLGSSVAVDVAISNIAPVVAAFGADELDYSLSVTGALIGGASGMDVALGGGNLHQFMLNTSTIGMQSGMLTVASSSQGAANALFTMPISFEVVANFLEADFNENGMVDAVDLATWNTNFGLSSGALKSQGDATADGDVDGGDFLVWQQQLGGDMPAVAASADVPEPGSAALVAVVAFVAGAGRRGRGRPGSLLADR